MLLLSCTNHARVAQCVMMRSMHDEAFVHQEFGGHFLCSMRVGGHVCHWFKYVRAVQLKDHDFGS